VLAAGPVVATFHQFWYPDWKAILGRKEHPLAREEKHGLIRLEVPAGEHELRIYFEDSPLRRTSKALAGAALLATALGAAVRGGKWLAERWRRRRGRPLAA
jgi:hypothetical protein